MRPPLDVMVLRTPELDRLKYPRLKPLNYPFGGTMGVGVRSAGRRNHSGWDLYATTLTKAFAIADGKVVQTCFMHGFGNTLLLEFDFRKRILYALYAHLTRAIVTATRHRVHKVSEGDEIALTGTTGNAAGGPEHLHFEVRTKLDVGPFPDGRISPGEVLGYFYDNMDNRSPFRDIG